MSPRSRLRLGVLDWGIGGVDALARLRGRFPHLDVSYWSDAGAPPYGTLAPKVLAARVLEVARRMGVTHLVVACNAASTALPGLALPCEVRGVIAPGVAAALASGARTLGVIGGARTIASGAWRAPLEAAGRRVIQRVAQPLSAHVEAGRLDGQALGRDLDAILAPLAGVDALALACTHYPAIAGPIAARLPGVPLLDPVEALVADVAARWPLAEAGGDGDLTAWTTGDPEATRVSAKRAFGVSLGEVRRARATDYWPSSPS